MNERKQKDLNLCVNMVEKKDVVKNAMVHVYVNINESVIDVRIVKARVSVNTIDGGINVKSVRV